MRTSFKFIGGCVCLGLSLYTPFRIAVFEFDGRQDTKIENSKKEIYKHIAMNREERNLKIASLDARVFLAISAMQEQQKESNKLLRVLVNRKPSQYVFKSDLKLINEKI